MTIGDSLTTAGTGVPGIDGDSAAETDGRPGLGSAGAADAERIQGMLDAIAETGDDGAGGITRLCYTESERAAHRLVAGWWSELGAIVRVDAAGNTTGELAGRRSDLAAVGMGSHLDSVVNGGRFDGVAGVVAATEVLRIIASAGGLDRPLRCVAFAAEEGARFGQACLGSRIASGQTSRADLDRMRDRGGQSVSEAMRSVGLDPEGIEQARWKAEEWLAFVEMHIEQGSVLERENVELGLVDLVSGSTRLRLEVIGKSSHSGGTPMRSRSDALAAAAEIILASEDIALDPRHRGTRVTVGRLDVEPGEITTIPGTARMYVDVRDIDSDRQRQTARLIAQRARSVCDRRGARCVVHVLADTSPVVLPAWLRDIVADACRQLGASYRVLDSGASHDAQTVNRSVPACMVFVPSRAGLSHIPDEWTSVGDLARGIDACARAIWMLDERMRTWTSPVTTGSISG